MLTKITSDVAFDTPGSTLKQSADKTPSFLMKPILHLHTAAFAAEYAFSSQLEHSDEPDEENLPAGQLRHNAML